MKVTRTCSLHGGRPAWRLLSRLVLVALACSTVVKADVRTSVRAQPPGGGRVLVLYTYYEAPKAADNLRFFVAKTILEPAQHRARRSAQLRNACTSTGGESDTRYGSQDSSSDTCSVGPSATASQDAMAEGVDYVFVISGHECSVQLPEGDEFPHVRVLSFDNTAGHDFGAWAEALDYFNLRSPAYGRDKIAVDDKPSGAWKEYGAFVFINSSCRGPFLPGYVSGTMHWATPFVSRLSEKVRLVGPSVHFIPSYSNEVAFCDPKRSSLWANISRTGAGPRLDGYMLVTDTVGLELLLRAGVFSRWEVRQAPMCLRHAVLARGQSQPDGSCAFHNMHVVYPVTLKGPGALHPMLLTADCIPIP